MSYFAVVAVVLVGALALWLIAISFGIRRDGRVNPLGPADAIVVFGAAVWPGGPSLSLRVRAARAAEVYAAGCAPVIFCSGGWSEGVSEAVAMKQLLIAAAVPASAILTDDGGISTGKAIRAAHSFAKHRNWQRLIAVSSPYHLHRIGLEARRQGLEVLLCPALRPGPRTSELRIFDTRQHLREVIAVAFHRCTGPVNFMLGHGPGRLAKAAGRHLVRRARWLLREADAMVEDSDTIADRTKQGMRGSDAVSAATPAMAGLAWPVRDLVTSTFGMRHHRLHAGIDIRAAYGSTIRAAAAGRVLVAERVGGYGNVSVIDHGAGLATLYAHLAGFIAAEGETVESGQALGFVGQTGRSSGPHLHFEVRVHGSPVDPLVYLSS